MRLNSFLILGVSVFLLSSSTLLAGTQSSSALRLSEAVETGPNYEVFGDPMPNKAAGLSLADLIDQRESYLEKEVRVSAKITQVCQAKGCFFIAVENDKWARITFRDYAFFVPTDAANSEALIEGIFSEVQLSNAQAQHYNSDLGSSSSAATVDTSPEYSIVASSVLIRKPI
nr:DUF4920 domain-containing protein [Luminiphilus sp.]